MTLDIPSKVNIPETRKRVYLYFRQYRYYRHLLAMDTAVFEPHLQHRPSLPGMDKFSDPDLIRVPYSVSSPVERELTKLTDEDRWREYVARTERKVNNLPPYGREIIKRRLMRPRKGHLDIHDLSSDTEVLESLKRDGWYAEKTYYDEQKAEAIRMFADSLGIIVLQE